MKIGIVGFFGAALALMAAAQVKVSNITAIGGMVQNGNLVVASGRPFVFYVRSSNDGMENCSGVWVVQNGKPFFARPAGIVSRAADRLSFRAMVNQGEEGTYRVYLCPNSAPTASDTAQAGYTVVSPESLASAQQQITIQANDQEAAEARRIAQRALSRIGALEKQVRELQGLNDRMQTLSQNVDRVQVSVDGKADKQDVLDVVSQVRTVTQETKNLASNLQSTQTTLNQVSQNLDQLSARLQNNENDIRQVRGRISAVRSGVMTLANDLRERKVGSKILWFIPKPVLKRQQISSLESEMNRQIPGGQ